MPTTRNERELAVDTLKGVLIAEGCRKIGELGTENSGGIIHGDFFQIGVWSTPGGVVLVREDWRVSTGKVEKPNRKPTRTYDMQSYELYARLTKEGTHEGTLKALREFMEAK